MTRSYFLFLFACLYLGINLLFLLSGRGSDRLPFVQHKMSEDAIDAVVLISIGKYASLTLTDASIESIRSYGQYKGAIYVITDYPYCFERAILKDAVTTIQIDHVNSLSEIKAMKCNIFNQLPNNVMRVLYVDVDVMVTRNLNQFFYDTMQNVNILSNKQGHGNGLGMFLDSSGHFFGYCEGCDKYHTGVIYAKRDHNVVECLKHWESNILSGRHNSDQESFDNVVKHSNYCKRAVFALPKSHLLFLKDYFGLFLSGTRSFTHVTAAGRPEEDSDWFYKRFVVPWFENKMDLRNGFTDQKQCQDHLNS